METVAIKILKLLATHGPLDMSSIRMLLGAGSASSVSAAIKRLMRHGLVSGFWLYSLTEKGKTALQFINECKDLRCLMERIER